MEKTDKLSRRPDWKVGVEKDNNNQVFIKDNQIRSLQEVVIDGLEVDILEKIKKTRSKNKEIVRVIEEMKKTEVKVIKGNEWQMKEDLVLKEGKMYVLKDKELRAKIIQLYHDISVAEYGGRWKTTELVTRNYWWPEVIRDVEGCNICQQMKNRTEEIAGKLKLSEVPEKL